MEVEIGRASAGTRILSDRRAAGQGQGQFLRSTPATSFLPQFIAYVTTPASFPPLQFSARANNRTCTRRVSIGIATEARIFQFGITTKRKKKKKKKKKRGNHEASTNPDLPARDRLALRSLPQGDAGEDDVVALFYDGHNSKTRHTRNTKADEEDDGIEPTVTTTEQQPALALPPDEQLLLHISITIPTSRTRTRTSKNKNTTTPKILRPLPVDPPTRPTPDRKIRDRPPRPPERVPPPPSDLPPGLLPPSRSLNLLLDTG